MRKFLSVILAVMMVFSAAVMPAQAVGDDVEVDVGDNFDFEINEGFYFDFCDTENYRAVLIAPQDKTVAEFVIPETITYNDHEFTVYSIADAAFDGCTNMASITIPNSVVSIGEYAFTGCGNLKIVNYGGNKAQWDDIDIETGNDALISATIKYAVCDHTFEWIIDEEATCGVDGVQHEECTVCGATQSENTAIPATGEHNFEWIIDEEATCGEAGVKHQECTACGATQNVDEPIAATGEHKYDNAFDKTCNICGDIRTLPEQSGGSDVEVDVGDQFLEIIGDYYYSLSEIDDKKAVLIAPVNDDITHVVIESEVVYDGENYLVYRIDEYAFDGCTNMVSITIPDSVVSIGEYAFTGCGNLKTVNYGGNKAQWDEIDIETGNTVLTSATINYAVCDHNFEWIIDEEATCGEAGVKHQECTVCGAKQNEGESIPATGEHIFDDDCDTDCNNDCGYTRETTHNFEWIIDEEATCGEAGVKHQECTVCGTTQSENTAINKTNAHTFDNACDIDCNNCGFERNIKHNFEWVIDKEANCGKTGIRHEECTVCHEIRNEDITIAATGSHTYSDDCDKSCNICGVTRIPPAYMHSND